MPEPVAFLYGLWTSGGRRTRFEIEDMADVDCGSKVGFAGGRERFAVLSANAILPDMSSASYGAFSEDDMVGDGLKDIITILRGPGKVQK